MEPAIAGLDIDTGLVQIAGFARDENCAFQETVRQRGNFARQTGIVRGQFIAFHKEIGF